MIEMVIAIVLVGIIIAATIFFAYPVRQAVDTTARAELTDTADNALQRMGREVRLALPNSVRVANGAGGVFIEFIPLRSAGRYRAESSGAVCDTGSDELAFDSADTCFKTIGTLPTADLPLIDTTKDLLVFNNYGEGFDGQNAYAKSGTLNTRRLTALANEGTRQALTFTSGTPLGRALHDSPGKRFYIVPGDGTWPSPVSYQCIPPELRRRSGYAMTAAQPSQPSDFSGGASDLLANNVASCVFDYQPSALGAGIGLLTLRLTLSKSLSAGSAETVTLYHAVHVNNVP